jgi:hypothetical protein
MSDNFSSVRRLALKMYDNITLFHLLFSHLSKWHISHIRIKATEMMKITYILCSQIQEDIQVLFSMSMQQSEMEHHTKKVCKQ